MGVSQSDRQWQQRLEQHLPTGGKLVIQLLLVVIITMEDIKKAIGEAEKELEVAESDISTFIDQETEEATKEDQMDLEGKCMRKKTDKRHFRRGGVRVGCTEGRDGF